MADEDAKKEEKKEEEAKASEPKKEEKAEKAEKPAKKEKAEAKAEEEAMMNLKRQYQIEDRMWEQRMNDVQWGREVKQRDKEMEHQRGLLDVKDITAINPGKKPTETQK